MCKGRGHLLEAPRVPGRLGAPRCPDCDWGICDQCNGEGQLPADAMAAQAPPKMDTITFEQGHESAADSPWGFQRIRVSTDGQLEYEHRSRTGTRVVRGTVDGERVKALRGEFGRTTFPQKPQETFQPGTSIIRLTVTPPTSSVLIDYFDGMQMDGYREIIRDLSELNNALREDNREILTMWRFERAPEATR